MVARPAAPLQTQWNRPGMVQAPAISTEPSIAAKFAGKVGERAAAKQLAKLPLAAADPTGGVVSGVASEMAPAAIGSLVGGWFADGGRVHPIAKQLADKGLSPEDIAHYMKNVKAHELKYGKPMYREMGGMTKGPLGMTDMLAAGKGKDVSKVTYKKTGGDITDTMEISYHAPLAPKE